MKKVSLLSKIAVSTLLCFLIVTTAFAETGKKPECSTAGFLHSIFDSEPAIYKEQTEKLVSEFDRINFQEKLSPEELTKILTVKKSAPKTLLGTYHRPRKEVIEQFYSGVSNSKNGIKAKTFIKDKTSWLKNEKPLDEIINETGNITKNQEQINYFNRYLYELKKGDLSDDEIVTLRNLFIPRKNEMTEEALKDYLYHSYYFIAANTKDKTQIAGRYQKFLEARIISNNNFNDLKSLVFKMHFKGSDAKVLDQKAVKNMIDSSDGSILEKIYPSAKLLPEDDKKFLEFVKLLSRKNSPEIDKNLESFFSKAYSTAFKNGQERITATEKFLRKKLSDTHDESIFNYFDLEELNNLNPTVAKDLTTRQNAIESRLNERMKHILEANAPPQAIHNPRMGWANYVKTIPSSQREEFTYQLLKKHGTNQARITHIIGNLEPTEGVKEAVARFLRESPLMNSNRTDFTQDQVRSMFGGNRFKNFFPWMQTNLTNGAVRTQFSLAIFTNPKLPGNRRLSLQWLRGKILDNQIGDQIPDFIGFRPALDHSRFNRALELRMTGNTYAKNINDQFRGLIVQGEYEKNGYSLMTANRERGDLQFEAIAPNITRNMERAISTGFLRNTDPLDRRLFVQNWAFGNSDSTLIERIRRNAIRVETLPDFWQIRVDIHNFPTTVELAKTKRYLASFNGDQNSRVILETLVKDLENFLGVDSKTGNNFVSIVEKLKLTNEHSDELKKFAKKFDNLSEEKKLKKLELVRTKFNDLKTSETSATKTIDRIIGEKTLSDQAALISNEYLQTIKKSGEIHDSKKVSEFASSLLNHLTMDDVLDASQVKAINQNLNTILRSKSLANERKLELVSDVLENTVDQVYYKLLNRYGDFDEKLYRLNTSTQSSVKFIDSQMRKGPTFILSKLTDELKTSVSAMKNATFEVAGENFKYPAQIYNPGKATGILRINKSPLQLSKNEIGVFSEMPTEMSPAAGMITLGTGARLSHVQLLAKSLGLPNAKLSTEYLEKLKSLEGKLVHFVADKDGSFAIHELAEDAGKVFEKSKNEIHIPAPNHDLKKPVSFGEVRESENGTIAGPKGMNLSKLYQDSKIGEKVPDGFILPFGYFKKYADQTGLTPLLDVLASTKMENKHTMVALSNKIQKIIQKTPIPEEMIDEAVKAVEALQSRTGHKQGYFFRSDTHIEDLEGFNAAGLNESVPNVLIDKSAIDLAIRKVWQSPFSEKSIDWRNLALKKETVTVAEPSVVVMPTVQASSSGVILSKGTDEFVQGKGKISANWGIGSVVESGRPVEEITLEAGPIHQSLTVSDSKPVAKATGGLEKQETTPGLPVLNETQIKELNKAAIQVEKTLGEKPFGYDIEWAYDADGKLIILQARPNMP
jgi:hypothetical protein